MGSCPDTDIDPVWQGNESSHILAWPENKVGHKLKYAGLAK